MPTVSHNHLTDFVYSLFLAVGANKKESEILSTHIVGANLAGHDSHGVIQIPAYIDRINVGHLVPQAPIEVLDETPTTAKINGNWGFGYVVTTYATELAIQKASEHNIGAITVAQQGHVGRVSSYPLMAADSGMIGMMTADSGRGPKAVVPFGGRDKRLGTNPISFAFPSNLEGPFFIDMATAAVASGKISLAESRGENIPLGWIVDKKGIPSTNPKDLSSGGSILPLGGDQGHKGYGLSAAVEIFSGILTGLGYGVSKDGIHNDGCLILVLKTESFRPLKDFKREITEFANYLRETPTAPGYDRVYYPGEIEHLTTLKRTREGIYLEDTTWNQLQELANEYGCEKFLTTK